MFLGENIRRARQTARLSQLDLGLRIGVSVRTVQRWEKEGIPGVYDLAHIATVTQTPIASFFAGWHEDSDS